ncbi:MAG: PKD domain-containing protein, partial [Candidatus Lutacidiplasmatales archaeon]
PSLSPGRGSTILSWNWSSAPGNASMHPGDSWSVSFDLVATGGPSLSAPVDSCATSACTEAENQTPGPPTSGAQFRSPPLPGELAESFPLLAVSVVAAPGLTGAVTPAISSGEALSPLSLQVAVAGGYAPFSVSWAFGDGTYENDSASMFVTHTYASGGFLHVSAVVRDKAGSTLNLSSWVTVFPPLEVSAGPGGIVGYAPLPLRFVAIPTGGLAPYNVTWQFDDGTGGNGTSLLHVFELPGLYVVVVTESDALGYSATATLTVDVGGAPTGPPLAGQAMVTAEFPTGCPAAPERYHFAGSASGGQPPYAFSWTFGDGTRASGASVVHVYTGGGPPSSARVPTLTVTDATGATANASAPLPMVEFAPPPCRTLSTSTSAPLGALIEIGAGSALVLAAVVAVVVWRRRNA